MNNSLQRQLIAVNELTANTGPSTLTFTNFATAQNTHILVASQTPNLASLVFTGNSQPGASTMISVGTDDIGFTGNTNTGLLDFSGSSGPNGDNKIALGALAGNGGTVALGSNALTVGALNESTSFRGQITGFPGASLVKVGSATLYLSGGNNYTGGTTVNGGTLQIGEGGTTGSIAGDVINNATLAFQRSDGIIFSNVISGTGRLVQAGTGTLTLTGNNTYGGGTTINAGTLQVGNLGLTSGTGTLGTGAVTNNAALVFALSNGVVSNVIDGTGSVTQKANSTLTLTGVNLYTGATSITAGRLVLSGSGSIASSRSVSVTGGIGVLGGVFDISGTPSGASIKSLAGDGTVALGSKTLTLTAAADTFSGTISGSAGIVVAGGVQTLVGPADTANPDGYTGATSIGAGATLALSGREGVIAASSGVVNNGTLDISGTVSAATIKSLSGNGSVLLGSKTLIIGTGIGTFSGVISGSGNLASGGFGGRQTLSGVNTYTGSTRIFSGNTLALSGVGSIASSSGVDLFSGVFDISGVSDGASVRTVTGSGTLALGSKTLTLTAAFGSFAGSITGTGTTVISNGTLIVSGATIASGATLQVGDGAGTGNISGNIANNSTLIFNRSDALIFAGVISGTGTITKLGVGTATLSGINTYSGPTAISAGTLNVTGTLSNSNTNVANGGTLTGTGSVRNVTVASGATVGPLGTGTLTVQGNLTLNSGANYADSITPSTAGLTNVSGTAGLGGTAVISAGAGAYSAGQRYTLLNASGGIGGAFSSLTMLNLPGNVRGELAYDATRVYLDLKTNAVAPLLPSGASANQISIAAGIDAGLQRGPMLNSGFTALFNLQGAALGSALNQIAGQGAPNIATAGGQSLTPFLSVMQGQGASGGNGTDTVANFAPNNSYDAADAPRRAQRAGEMRVWGSVYGGHTGISASAASGAAGLSASNVGFIAGIETNLPDGLRLGASAGFGNQDFSSANSTGDSDDVMLGLYARQDILEQGYLTAAFAYSWHGISTTRTITVAGTDVLGAKFDAHAIGGRIEGGWRLALDDAFGLTPFAALAGDNFYAPAYSEGVISGNSNFALSYGDNKTNQKHVEIGAHLDHGIDLGGSMLSADARVAWAHQLDDAPFVTAAFQGLPGSTFRLLGVRAATDTALLGLGLKIRNPDGLDIGLRMDSQVGAGTTVLQGMGTVSWRW